MRHNLETEHQGWSGSQGTAHLCPCTSTFVSLESNNSLAHLVAPADYFCELNVLSTVHALVESCPGFWRSDPFLGSVTEGGAILQLDPEWFCQVRGGGQCVSLDAGQQWGWLAGKQAECGCV
jgi:hypothetical protein